MPVQIITKENIAAEVMDSTKPVLLQFFATWCGPCRMLTPVVEQVADENPDIKVGKIDIDEEPELASKFGVMSVPTLFAIKDGEIISTEIGVRPKAAILNMFK